MVELGVGTGVIANGLRSHGLDVVGFDLSEAMMRTAIDRIGPRVAMADADQLPVAGSTIDTAFLVWVLQLVDDPAITLSEAARVVRPGGRVIAITSGPEYGDDDEIARIMDGLEPVRQMRLGQGAAITSSRPGLELVHHGFTTWDDFESTPAVEADAISDRIYSSLFDVDDHTWRRVVVPVIEQLRALPEPDRARRRRNRHPLLVWNVTPGVEPSA